MNTMGLSPAAIAVWRVTSDWEAAPKISVVESAAHLPVPAPPDALGLYYRHQVWICADQSHRDVARILAHEAVAHYGVRQALGKAGWRRFVLAVGRGARKGGDTFLRSMRARVRRLYRDDHGANYLRPSAEADEVIAAVAEQIFDVRSGRLLVHDPLTKQFEAGIGQLAREYLCLDLPVCSRQVEGMLLQSEHELRYGGPWWGAGFRARRALQALAVVVGATIGWGLFMV